MTGTSYVTMTTEPPGMMNGIFNLYSLYTCKYIYCISRLVNAHINMTKIINCTHYCSSAVLLFYDIHVCAF